MLFASPNRHKAERNASEDIHVSLLSLLLALVSQSSYRDGYPLPDARVPSGLGVNIHIVRPKEGQIKQIADTGFKWIRMDFFWEEVERKRGEFNFKDYDRLVSQLEENHLRILFILDYGNKLYGQGAPRTPEYRAKFVNFVHQTVQHYRHRGIVWEMWNEPNIHFWEPQPNVQEYVQLAKEVSREFEENAADEWLIGPATSTFDWAFLESCFNSGLLSSWDAVSIHPYRSENPETAISEWKRLRSLVQQYKPEGKRIELISGEWGYSDFYTGREMQSQYVVRQYLTNLAAGVPLSIWYDWSDDTDNPKESEAHFGVVDRNLTSKPAHDVLQNFLQEMSGWIYSGSGTLPPNGRLHKFKKDSYERWIAYAEDGRRGTYTLSLPAGDYRVRPLNGGASLRHSDGSMDLQLDGTPIVVSKVVTGS